jgi:hypothetical protein
MTKRTTQPIDNANISLAYENNKVSGIVDAVGNYKKVLSVPGNKAGYMIPFGDSFFASMWRPTALTGGVITASNGLATLTLTAASSAYTGAYFRLALSPTDEYNDIHQVYDCPTLTTVRFVCSANAPASETLVNQTAWFNTSNSITANCINVMKAFSKNRFYMPYNGAVGGDDSSEALLRFEKDLLSQKPNSALILLGTNDSAGSDNTNINIFVANMTKIYTRCLDAGIIVYACTIPPMGATNASVADTTRNRFILQANKWIVDYVSKTPGMFLHDFYSWATDPAHAQGAMSSTYCTDGTHFNTQGCYLIGKKMAANFDTWLSPAVERLPMSQADGYTFDTSSKNRWLNHLFQGAGPDATSWSTAFQGTGNTKTSSVVARTLIKDGDILGNNQKIAMNSTASGSAGTSLVIQDCSARLTAGKTYIVRAACSWKKGSFTTLNLEISITSVVSSISKAAKAGFVDVFDDTGYAQFETPPFIYPSGVSSVSFYLRGLTTGSASDGFVEWGRVTFEEQ